MHSVSQRTQLHNALGYTMNRVKQYARLHNALGYTVRSVTQCVAVFTRFIADHARSTQTESRDDQQQNLDPADLPSARTCPVQHRTDGPHHGEAASVAAGDVVQQSRAASEHAGKMARQSRAASEHAGKGARQSCENMLVRGRDSPVRTCW